MLSRTRNSLFLIQNQLSRCLNYRYKNKDSTEPKLTGEQKEKLLSKLPKIEDTDKVLQEEPKEYFKLSTDVDTQQEMDKIRARGLLKYHKPYNPPSNIQDIVENVIETVAGKINDLAEFQLSDLNEKFQILNELGQELGLYVPNSDLHKLKTGADVLEFYSTSKTNLTKYAEMSRDNNLPENLKIREHPARFHPNDIESHHGGITAYPGEGGNVITLRNKRLYRSFKSKKEWYDYEDQSFDYTPPDKGMPWDTEISQKMDRYIDKKFKINNLG